MYSAFQVRPFDKTFSNSLIVRPIKHPSCKCHEYVYMCDMKTFVLDKKCANHDHRVRAHRYLITPWFVSVPGKHVYYFSFSSFVLLLGILNCRTFCSYASMELCSCRWRMCDLVARVDRAPARFESWLRVFLCPTLVTCWLFHFHICFTELNIYHLSPMCDLFCPSLEGSPKQSWTLDSTLWILDSSYRILDSLSVTL